MMEKVFLLGKTDQNMMVNGKTEKKKEKVYIQLKMVLNMMEIGKMIY